MEVLGKLSSIVLRFGANRNSLMELLMLLNCMYRGLPLLQVVQLQDILTQRF